jgi:hypothetical protein
VAAAIAAAAAVQAHASPVTSLALHQVDATTLLVASTSADPALQLWHCHHGSSSRDSLQSSSSSFKELQEQLNQQFGEAAWQLQPPVHVGTQIQHCVALASLPNNTDVIVMATGGTDSHVRLFVRMPGVASDMLVAEKQEPDAKQQQQQ